MRRNGFVACVVILIFMVLVTGPVLGADSEMEKDLSREVKGAKRITPVLDLVGDELARVGIKLLDNASFGMEKLWSDTVNWNISKKNKV